MAAKTAKKTNPRKKRTTRRRRKRNPSTAAAPRSNPRPRRRRSAPKKKTTRRRRRRNPAMNPYVKTGLMVLAGVGLGGGAVAAMKYFNVGTPGIRAAAEAGGALLLGIGGAAIDPALGASVGAALGTGAAVELVNHLGAPKSAKTETKVSGIRQRLDAADARAASDTGARRMSGVEYNNLGNVEYNDLGNVRTLNGVEFNNMGGVQQLGPAMGDALQIAPDGRFFYNGQWV